MCVCVLWVFVCVGLFVCVCAFDFVCVCVCMWTPSISDPVKNKNQRGFRINLGGERGAVFIQQEWAGSSFHPAGVSEELLLTTGDAAGNNWAGHCDTGVCEWGVCVSLYVCVSVCVSVLIDVKLYCLPAVLGMSVWVYGVGVWCGCLGPLMWLYWCCLPAVPLTCCSVQWNISGFKDLWFHQKLGGSKNPTAWTVNTACLTHHGIGKRIFRIGQEILLLPISADWILFPVI